MTRWGSRGASGSGARGRVDRVRDHEHVRRPPPALGDVVALALGERDHGVHRVDPLEDARVRGVDLGVPAVRLQDVEVVHDVDDVDALGPDRDDVGDGEARVDEQERAALRVDQLADPVPEPLGGAWELAHDLSVRADLLDPAAAARAAGQAERGGAQVGRAVRAQVVVDRAGLVRGAVGELPRGAAGVGLLPDAMGAQVREGLPSGLRVTPAVLAVVLVDAEEPDAVEQPALEQLIASLLEVRGRAEDEDVGPRARSREHAVAHQQRARLAARGEADAERAREVAPLRQDDVRHRHTVSGLVATTW